MDFDKISYVFSAKTTDAELRGVKELSREYLDQDFLLPTFELTRSRTSKNNTLGDIEKRMEQISDICGERPFILDLTSHEDLSNSQIERLYDDEDGFRNWRNFLYRFNELDIIPAIHTYTEQYEESLRKEVRHIAESHEKMAFRMDSQVNATEFLDVISGELGDLSRVILLLDAGYVEEKNYQEKALEVTSRLQEINAQGYRNVTMTILSSSFPSSVLSRAGGNDDYGRLRMKEKDLFNEAQRSTDLDIIYGDYASIHPVRYDTRGGAWVPRVDVPLDNEYLYTRYRREEGGYIKAASEMLSLDEYDITDCWAEEQISAAANKKPNGKSPSFWISVRLNGHISRIINSKLRS